MKKAMSLVLASILLLSLLSGCGGGGKKTEVPEVDLPAINEIKLGEDYQDITATVKVLTNRTDVVDTIYAGYAEQFHQLYPNITVEYEAVSDYEQALNLRLPNGDWGDICFIPTSVAKSDYATYFSPLGDMNTLDEIYHFISDKSYNGVTYGIANGGNADGIAYNKAVFEAAGYTSDQDKLDADPSLKPLPASVDDFIQALKDIKEKTDAIPLYTNFSDKWPMGAWDAYICVAATGDPDFHNYTMVHKANPFSDPGDGTGPFNVYRILYEAVARACASPTP